MIYFFVVVVRMTVAAVQKMEEVGIKVEINRVVKCLLQKPRQGAMVTCWQ
jgi:hypothetical protein